MNPVWKYVDGVEQYEPIFSPDDIPDDSRDYL